MYGRLKPVLLHAQIVVADRELRDTVNPGIVGHFLKGGAAFYRLGGDSRSRNGSAALIGDGAGDRSSDILGDYRILSPKQQDEHETTKH